MFLQKNKGNTQKKIIDTGIKLFIGTNRQLPAITYEGHPEP